MIPNRSEQSVKPMMLNNKQSIDHSNDAHQEDPDRLRHEIGRLKKELSIKQTQIDLLTDRSDVQSIRSPSVTRLSNDSFNQAPQNRRLSTPSTTKSFRSQPTSMLSSSHSEPTDHVRLVQTIKQLRNDLSINQSIHQSQLDDRDRRIASLMLSVNRLRGERDYLMNQSLQQSNTLSISQSTNQSIDKRMARLEISHRAHHLSNQTNQHIELPNWLPRDARYLIRAFVAETNDLPHGVFNQSISQSIVEFSLNLSNVWRQKMHERIEAVKESQNETISTLKRQLNARIPYTSLIRERSVNQSINQTMNQSELRMLDVALELIDKLEAQVRRQQSTRQSIDEATDCVRVNAAAFVERVIMLSTNNDQSAREELQNECDEFMAAIEENLAINDVLDNLDQHVDHSLDTS